MWGQTHLQAFKQVNAAQHTPASPRVTSSTVISRVAVLPQAPLLVPELMGASVAGSAPMRSACLDAATRLAEVSQDWVVLAPASAPGAVGPDSRGSFRGYGADVEVSLGGAAGAADAGDVDPTLPLSALIAGWLRERAGAHRVRVELVAEWASPGACARVAGELAATARETALLVLGDGSNRRGARAPGGHDDRAEGFDAEVSRALSAGDCRALGELDPATAAELGASGRAPWQVLAALARRGDWRTELLYSDAPFGVGYHVAVWDRV